MSPARFLWMLLCFAQNVTSSDLLEKYEPLLNNLFPRDNGEEMLPIVLGKDWTSGCFCRASMHYKIIVCFGSYECRKFPKVTVRSEVLKVRTSVITELHRGVLDSLYYLKALEIEANHKLRYIQPGVFSNLTNLQRLSISYNTLLQSIHEDTFEGLFNLNNLTLVNNGFGSILQLTPAFKPNVLPSLVRLDLSENSFETISENAFQPMAGTTLRRLHLNLCRLDYIHPNSLLPLKHLKKLQISDNDLNSSLIANFLESLITHNINLLELDLSGLGFRKRPPRRLLNIIANSTIHTLILARNQFENLNEDLFPRMVNMQVLDLRKVVAIWIGFKSFNPEKFPNLKVLLLSGNNLPGIHGTPMSNQIMFLDLSNNRGFPSNPVFFEIDRHTFTQSRDLQVLNLAFNRVRSIFDYTFTGLENLRKLDMQNDTIYLIGPGSFKPLKRLEMLNLANNPLTSSENLTCAQFEGLNMLKMLSLENCGIHCLQEDENIFEMTPNLTHLVLRNNQLFYITAEVLKPLKLLKFLDLSENLLISWWQPIFLGSGVQPTTLLLMNNKISHFSISMIEDFDYLLETNNSSNVLINVIDNIFVCDCRFMSTTNRWLQANGSKALKQYFSTSKFQCSSPDLWEKRRVSEYLASLNNLHCMMYEKVSSMMVLVWTAPSLVTVILVVMILVIIYKYKVYIRYWMFLAKIALGKKLPKRRSKRDLNKSYKYDAFVSYSNDDSEFVQEMIVQFESKPPYLKLCVSERDFEIGAFISESIMMGIHESKYIILIISNSFAKSQWCRWEAQLAEYHRMFLEDGTSYDPLILVRLGNIQRKYLTMTLKYLLRTKIYHSWDEKNIDEFWNKLRNVISKPMR